MLSGCSFHKVSSVCKSRSKKPVYEDFVVTGTSISSQIFINSSSRLSNQLETWQSDCDDDDDEMRVLNLYVNKGFERSSNFNSDGPAEF